jgi:hypothetical protein
MEEAEVRDLIEKSVSPILDRVEKLESNVGDVGKWQARYGEKIDNIEKSIGTIISDIRAISEKPQKRWDAVVAAFIAALVSAAISILIR